MKKFTEKQILEGFRAWEQRTRDNPKGFMTSYEVFQQSVDKVAILDVKTLLKYIEKASE